MFIYTRPVYPRTSWEKIFKQVYNLGLVILFAAWIIEFTQFHTKIGDTFGTWWSATSFQLTPTMEAVLVNCSTTLPMKVNSIVANVQINRQSLPYHFVSVTNAMLGIFIISGGTIVFDFLAKTFFILNVRHLRIGGLHLNINSYCVFMVFLTSLGTVCLIGGLNPLRKVVRDFVAQCAQEYNARGQRIAEVDQDVPFTVTCNLILAATIINFAGYVFALFKLVADGLREPSKRLLKEQFYWEKGVLCRPDKRKLISESVRVQFEEARVMGVAVALPSAAIEAAPLRGGEPTDHHPGGPTGGVAAERLRAGETPRMASYGDGRGGGDHGDGAAEELDIIGGDDGGDGFADADAAAEWPYNPDYDEEGNFIGDDGKGDRDLRRHGSRRHRRRRDETEEERADRRARREQRRREREESGAYDDDRYGSGAYDGPTDPAAA